MLTLEIVTCKLLLVKKDIQFNNFSQFRFVCGLFCFLNHLAPPSKGELMQKAPYFIFIYLFIRLFGGLRVHAISLNLIAFIKSIETKASLLALSGQFLCSSNAN